MKKFTRNVLLTGLLTSATAAAFAGGGMHTPAVNFNGAYLGLQAGLMSIDIQNDYFVSGAFNDNYKDARTGVSGGLLAGYGMQMHNNFYLGANADINWNNDKFKDSISLTGVSGNVTVESAIKHAFSISADAGYLLKPNTLLFLRGGLAGGKVDHQITVAGIGASSNKTQYGYLLGVGIKSMITPNVFLQALGTYSRLSDTTVTVASSGIGEKFKPRYYQLMMGIGYKF